MGAVLFGWNFPISRQIVGVSIQYKGIHNAGIHNKNVRAFSMDDLCLQPIPCVGLLWVLLWCYQLFEVTGMSTTSLKLSDELKQRAANAAHQIGVSPHAFMLNAIEQAAAATEQRTRFLEDAHVARNDMIKTGKGFDADEVHTYLKAKVTGKKEAKPKAHSWRA